MVRFELQDLTLERNRSMSTRAMYTFFEDDVPEDERFNVYKHHDGYPSGGLDAIAFATQKAWELPRYEADEFAAAFVAANKNRSGGVNLLPSGDWKEVAPLDLEYRYEVWFGKTKPTEESGSLNVRIYAISCTDWETEPPIWSETLEYQGSFGGARLRYCKPQEATN